MGLTRHMTHFDREELYTDLEARILYLHSFLDFSSSTSNPLPPPPPQNDLMAKWHVRDGAEFAAPGDEPEIEGEGYLHGRKVLESESDENKADPAIATDGGPRSSSKLPRPSSADEFSTLCGRSPLPSPTLTSPIPVAILVNGHIPPAYLYDFDEYFKGKVCIAASVYQALERTDGKVYA
ncbi:hypothetical protein EsH8_XI_000087 [Colletotrichum jinshuiense]